MSDGLLGAGALLGVATAGYQIEGGYNGPGQPANNWATWERMGVVTPSGVACRFWDRPEEVLDRAAALGLDAFRLSVEWARVEPERGQVDEDALAHYAAIVDGCAERGLTPVVTLQHFTHPLWAGEEFWLFPGSPERYAAHVGRVLEVLGRRCRHWVTVNEPNGLALAGWVLGVHPPGRRLAVSDAMVVVDNLMAAHVLAYQAVHAARPDAVVTVNPRASTVYEFDRLLTDLLEARRAGVARADVDRWVAERRAAHDARVPARSVGEAALRRLTAGLSPVGATGPSGLARSVPGRAVEAVYASSHERCLDVAAVSFYDPVPTAAVSRPGRPSSGGRSRAGVRPAWDAPPRPDLLAERLAVAAADHPGLGVLVAENGMATRTRHGRPFPRRDGWTRPEHLDAHLSALVQAAEAGVPVAVYLHWTLADCYEWGSYEPRFGLFGVDRDRSDGPTWMDTDAAGDDSAGRLRCRVEALRQGDRGAFG